jgi:hypothetical protein
MKVGTKEHYELMEQFERDYPHLRLDRENGSLWTSGMFYENGETNNYFKFYSAGYSFGRSVYMD